MAKKFVRNITHTNLRAKDKPNEPLYTNVQNDLLSDEHDAFIRNEDANQPDEHYVLLTGNVETDRVDSSDSDILSVEKHDKHGLTFHPKHVKIDSTDKEILEFTEDQPHEFTAHPKHTKITTKNDELKVSEDKPLEFEIDDSQVKTNRKKIADHETRIKKNSDDIATNKTAIGKNADGIKDNTDKITAEHARITDLDIKVKKNKKDNKSELEEQKYLIENMSPLKLNMYNGRFVGKTLFSDDNYKFSDFATLNYTSGGNENDNDYQGKIIINKDTNSFRQGFIFVDFDNIKDIIASIGNNSSLIIGYKVNDKQIYRYVILEDYQYTEPVTDKMLQQKD